MDALFEMTNKGITSFKVQLPDHCNDLGVPIGPCAQCRCIEGVTLMKDELHPTKKKKKKNGRRGGREKREKMGGGRIIKKKKKKKEKMNGKEKKYNLTKK